MRRIVLFVIALLWVFGSGISAMAQKEKWSEPRYAQFLELMKDTKDYTGAKAELQKLAGAGDINAMNVLAMMYLIGEESERDYDKALELLKKTAFEGDMRGEYLLGAIEALGGFREVMLTFADNSKPGLTEADIKSGKLDIIFLKNMFMGPESQDKETNFGDAFQWFLIPDGKWEFADIMYMTGYILIKGKYGFINPPHSIYWLSRSKALGNKNAEELLKQIEDVKKELDNEWNQFGSEGKVIG